MKKLFAILALSLLLMPAVAHAQPAGCTWEGDPYLRYGFSSAANGIDLVDAVPGDILEYTLAPYNAAETDLPAGCKALDTLCFHISSRRGWPITCDPPMGDLYELPPSYLFYQNVSIEIPCGTAVTTKDTIIAIAAYANTAGACAPECGDCNDPNIRSGGGVYYNADTLIVTVVTPPPMLAILQDTLTLVDRGQTQAYIPFTICNTDICADLQNYKYQITTPGSTNIPAYDSGLLSVGVLGGDCKDKYGIIDASAALVCEYATLTIVVWTTQVSPALYDTCVQVIHVVEPVPVPLFTVPVVTILVLALILAAAVFMRRRAVSRA